MSWRVNPAIGCRDIKELEPQTAAAALAYQKAAKALGYDLIFTDTVRTQARQEWLYAQGRTRPGAIVTRTLDTVHFYRRAFDVVVVRGGKARYDLLAEVHAKLNPAKFGLEILSWEKPHMQKIGANGPNQTTPARFIAAKLGYKKAYP